jgi:hypothetical protein
LQKLISKEDTPISEFKGNLFETLYTFIQLFLVKNTSNLSANLQHGWTTQKTHKSFEEQLSFLLINMNVIRYMWNVLVALQFLSFMLGVFQEIGLIRL